MQLSGAIARAGGTPKSLDVTAGLVRSRPAGGFQIPGIRLTVRGQVEGLDADGFLAAAEDAKAVPGEQGADRRRDHAGRRTRTVGRCSVCPPRAERLRAATASRSVRPLT